MNKVGKGVSLNFCLEKIIEYWICLIIFLIPAYIFSFKIWLIPTNPLEILIGVLFIFWFFLNFRELPKIAKGVFKNRFFLPIFLIFLGVTLSTIFSADIKTSAGIWKGWFVVPLLFFIVVANETKNKKQSKNIVLSLFFSGVGVALISLFYFFSNNLTYDGRLSGFYISPNYLAMCLSPVLILSLWLYFCLEKQLFKVFLFTGQCLLLATVFLTYSYSAWAGLAAALLFVSVFQKLSSRNSVSGWKPSFCVLLIIISFFFSQINSPKFQELLDFSYPSLSSRLAIWQSAGEIIKDHPLNGIGPGLFQKYYLDKQTDFGLYPEWAVPQPHNLFLAFWLQTGLIGLIGFIWLMVSFFKSGFKALFGIRHSLSAVFLMAAMVYILTHGLTDTTYWKNDLSIVFWLVLALSRNNRKKYKGSPFREIQGQPF